MRENYYIEIERRKQAKEWWNQKDEDKPLVRRRSREQVRKMINAKSSLNSVLPELKLTDDEEAKSLVLTRRTREHVRRMIND